MRTKTVAVLPYDPAWKEAFERIKAPLWERLQTWLSAVEHVGSTSVEGLWAKPIIDLDLVLKEPGFFPQVKQELALLGYFHEGDLGIPQREAFAYQDKPDLMAHHLYVCPPDSLELRRHLTFRDYLRTHPAEARKYSEVKRQAAALFPHDIDGYMAQKDACVKELYQKCSLL